MLVVVVVCRCYVIRIDKWIIYAVCCAWLRCIPIHCRLTAPPDSRPARRGQLAALGFCQPNALQWQKNCIIKFVTFCNGYLIIQWKLVDPYQRTFCKMVHRDSRVRAFGIIGGGSVLAAAVTVGTLSTLPYVLPANTTAAVVSKLLVINMWIHLKSSDCYFTWTVLLVWF